MNENGRKRKDDCERRHCAISGAGYNSGAARTRSARRGNPGHDGDGPTALPRRRRPPVHRSPFREHRHAVPVRLLSLADSVP